jgi:choline dehydrogenase
MFFLTFLLLAVTFRNALSNTAPGIATLKECPNTKNATYDYIVVGSGAGGGPVAARLAEGGFSGAVPEICFFKQGSGATVS